MTETERTLIAQQPLFAPLAAALAAFHALPASCSDLNAYVDRMAQGPVSGGGMPIRFVAPASGHLCYEQRVFSRGEVETRADNWHDFFNALVWLTFPRIKAALNRRHHEALTGQRAGEPARRGPVRDAATQFDECGVVVISADAGLLDLLQAHRWRELFWDRRGDVVRHLGVFVVGHALYDQLRTPFVGLCGKALLVELPQNSWASSSFQVEAVDEAVACLLADAAAYARPRQFQPLPLLGIPGAVLDNARAEYYADGRQFRPARTGGERALRVRVELTRTAMVG